MLLCEILISENPGMLQILAYSAVGFCLVMLVLSVQAALTDLLGRIFSLFDERKKVSEK